MLTNPGGCSAGRLGPVDPSFRALSGRLKFTARRHKFITDFLSLSAGGATVSAFGHGALSMDRDFLGSHLPGAGVSTER